MAAVEGVRLLKHDQLVSLLHGSRHMLTQKPQEATVGMVSGAFL